MSNVDDDENEVCMNLPSTESITPTSNRFDSASTDGAAGSKSNHRTTASNFLITYPKPK